MEITVKHVIIIVAILVAKPSTPSVRLIAFDVPTITKIANGIYNHIGIVIYVLKNGIKISVFIPIY